MKAKIKTSFKRKILFLICSCHCYKSILSSDEQVMNEFRDRHKREPREQNTIIKPRFPSLSPTINPSNDPCITENVEITGSYRQVNIPYNYEITIESTSEPVFENEILPGIERQISKTVLPFLFDSCAGSTQIQKRQLKTQIAKQQNYRILQLQRMTSSPSDKVDHSALCSILDDSNDESLCHLINGGLTLFFDERSTEDDIKAKKDEIYSILKLMMKTESYAEVHKGIIEMVFVVDNLPFLKPVKNSPIDPPILPPTFPKQLSFILIGAISGTLILISFCIGENGQQSIRQINDDFEVEITSAITDQHSYDQTPRDTRLQDENHPNFDAHLSDTSSNPDLISLGSDELRLGATASSPSTNDSENNDDDNPLLSFFGLTTLLFQNENGDKRESSKGSLDNFASD